jgi:dihydrofolate reductase
VCRSLSSHPDDRNLFTKDIRRIKSQDGPDLILSGSSTLTSTLLEHGLTDGVLLIVSPVLLGAAKRYFAEGTPARSFELVSTKRFRPASSSVITSSLAL